jgi:hypothetical protein
MVVKDILENVLNFSWSRKAFGRDRKDFEVITC